MKKLFFFAISFICLSVFQFSHVKAQGIGINSSGNAPNPSAGLDVDFNNKGLLIPRLTTAQRDAITSPALGLQIYNTDCNNFNYYNGSSWIALGNSGTIAMPGAITGATAPCQNATSVTYSIAAVSGATGYNWIVPQGAAIVSGQGTTFISVNFAATNGSICVTASNACGTSSAVCTIITLSIVPAAPTAATNTATPQQITWNWNAVPSAAGYKYNTVNNYSSAIDNNFNTSFTQTGLNCNTSYSLYVWTYNVCGNSTPTILTQTTGSCCSDGTGGTITHTGGYTIHTFTTTGTFSINCNTTVEVLVVAGGGAGGRGGSGEGSGGGGAGGLLYQSGYAVNAGTYTVTVGNGGPATSGSGGNGENSSFISLVATGGGGGAAGSGGSPSGTGGSGGGGGYSSTSGASGTSGQGNAGGNYSSDNFRGGGGGGAGAQGNNGGSISSVSGKGGNGLQYSISGTPTYYAGGGGGGTYDYPSPTFASPGGLGGGGNGGEALYGTPGSGPGSSGAPNTGGGGGGAGYESTAGGGGSGIVIIKYATP